MRLSDILYPPGVTRLDPTVAAGLFLILVRKKIFIFHMHIKGSKFLKIFLFNPKTDLNVLASNLYYFEISVLNVYVRFIVFL